MIFKQIFGKTVEAAMKSAKQIYGDDFTVFQTLEGNENQQPGISLIADKKIQAGESLQHRKKEPVYFEKTKNNGSQGKENRPIDKELRKLRHIAESQIAKSAQKRKPSKNHTDEKFRNKTEFTPVSAEKLNNDTKPFSVYSRKSVRSADSAISKVSAPEVPENSPDPVKRAKRTRRGLLSRFDESKPTIDEPAVNKTVFNDSKIQSSPGKGLETLHKRFDKLEALFHSELMSANMDYAAHPVFQQLIQTGIPSKVITEWFKRIMKKNIDPFNDSESFVLEISKILKKALTSSKDTEPCKFKLFIGFSGSGKTSLIMKLILDDDLSKRKDTAVLSVIPEAGKRGNYYTILEPFCKENGIDYFKAGTDSDLSDISSDLNKYEQIFIDTPSLSVEKKKANKEYRKLRQLLSSISKLNVHLTVNMTANYGDYQDLTADSSAINPDFIALTHMDEIEKWGPVIPLFEKAGCSGSYLSIGNSLTDSLKTFDAAWLTKNILEKTD